MALLRGDCRLSGPALRQTLVEGPDRERAHAWPGRAQRNGRCGRTGVVVVVLRFGGVQLRSYMRRASEQGFHSEKGLERMSHGGLLLRGGSATSPSHRRPGPTDD